MIRTPKTPRKAVRIQEKGFFTSTPTLPSTSATSRFEFSLKIPSIIATPHPIQSPSIIEWSSFEDLMIPRRPLETKSQERRTSSESAKPRIIGKPKPQLHCRNVKAATLPKTPRCAKPTKAWLNRIAAINATNKRST